MISSRGEKENAGEPNEEEESLEQRKRREAKKRKSVDGQMKSYKEEDRKSQILPPFSVGLQSRKDHELHQDSFASPSVLPAYVGGCAWDEVDKKKPA